MASSRVVGAVRRAGWAVVNHEEQLTALDQAMGDGDLGITLSKIGQALIAYADSTPVDGDLGKWLGKAGMAANKAGSSSFGTLLATALMRGGKAVTGTNEWSDQDLATVFQAADAGVQERGKAQVGDKTVIDAMHPAAEAFAAAIAEGKGGQGSRPGRPGSGQGRARQRHPAAQQNRPRRLGGRTHRRPGGSGLRSVHHYSRCACSRVTRR